MDKNNPIAFDFFCGAGGFSLGLIQSGFEVIGAMDINPESAMTYMANLGSFPIQIHYTSSKYEKILIDYYEKYFKKMSVKERMKFHSGSGWISSEREKGNYYPPVKNFFFGDIQEVSGEWILDKLGLLPGQLDLIVGGPPCQGFSRANGKASVNDIRNKLVMEFGKKIKEMNPKYFAMEEVPEILKYKLPNGNNYVEELLDYIGANKQFTVKFIQPDLFENEQRR